MFRSSDVMLPSMEAEVGHSLMSKESEEKRRTDKS